MTGVSPTTGAYAGGTLVTITGRNFPASKDEVLVSFGEELNTLCTIVTISSNQITCRTPHAHRDWSELTQRIIITSQLRHDCTRDGSCQFTYADSAASPA